MHRYCACILSCVTKVGFRHDVWICRQVRWYTLVVDNRVASDELASAVKLSVGASGGLVFLRKSISWFMKVWWRDVRGLDIILDYEELIQALHGGRLLWPDHLILSDGTLHMSHVTLHLSHACPSARYFQFIFSSTLFLFTTYLDFNSGYLTHNRIASIHHSCIHRIKL